MLVQNRKRILLCFAEGVGSLFASCVRCVHPKVAVATCADFVDVLLRGWRLKTNALGRPLRFHSMETQGQSSPRVDIGEVIYRSIRVWRWPLIARAFFCALQRVLVAYNCIMQM